MEGREEEKRKYGTCVEWRTITGRLVPQDVYTPSPACILQTGEREWTSKGEDWKKSAQRTGQVPSTTVSLS